MITTPFHPGYINAERLAKAKKLKLALTAGIGSDHVDLPAAAEAGVTVAEITGQSMFSTLDSFAEWQHILPVLCMTQLTGMNDHHYTNVQLRCNAADGCWTLKANAAYCDASLRWRCCNRHRSRSNSKILFQVQTDTSHADHLVSGAGSNVVSVAEHVVMMILALVRNYMPAYRQVCDKEWNVAEIAKK